MGLHHCGQFQPGSAAAGCSGQVCLWQFLGQIVALGPWEQLGCSQEVASAGLCRLGQKEEGDEVDLPPAPGSLRPSGYRALAQESFPVGTSEGTPVWERTRRGQTVAHTC